MKELGPGFTHEASLSHVVRSNVLTTPGANFSGLPWDQMIALNLVCVEKVPLIPKVTSPLNSRVDFPPSTRVNVRAVIPREMRTRLLREKYCPLCRFAEIIL